MEFEVRRVDLTPKLAANEELAVMVERPRRPDPGNVYGAANLPREGTFWTMTNVTLDGPLEWAVTRRGDVVRVPLFRMRVRPASAGEYALTHGVMIGMRARNDLARRKVDVAMTVIFIGTCSLPAHEDFLALGLMARSES